MTNKEIANRIKYLRKERGLSARKLSILLDKHETYINKVECTDVNLPVESLMQILEQLQVATEQFFAPNYRTWHMDRSIEHGFATLPEESRRVILSMLSVMR